MEEAQLVISAIILSGPHKEEFNGPHLFDILSGLCVFCRVTFMLNHSGRATARPATITR